MLDQFTEPTKDDARIMWKRCAGIHVDHPEKHRHAGSMALYYAVSLGIVTPLEVYQVATSQHATTVANVKICRKVFGINSPTLAFRESVKRLCQAYLT